MASIVRLYGLCLLTFVLVFVGIAQSKEGGNDIKSQKGELEQIQKEVDQGRRKLDSLKEVEVGLLKQVSGFDQKIATNNKVVNRLTSQLQQIQGSIAEAESNYGSSQENLERTRRRYLGTVRQLYISIFESDPVHVDRPNLEMELSSRVTYLAAVAGFDSSVVVEAKTLLDESLSQLSDLSGQKSEVAKLKRSKETSTSLEKRKKERQEKELAQLRRRKSEEADRILMLQQAAEEMQAIIDRLEQEFAQNQWSQQNASPSAFATLKGQLLSPFRGKVVTPFGHKVDPVTKLKSFSPGITIKGKPGRPVTSVAAGVVAYRGQLRGYGNFVIINHDDQYFTTYAGLGEITAEERAYLQAGAVLGKTGPDGTVRFELRQGREVLDPVEWIKIESF